MHHIKNGIVGEKGLYRLNLIFIPHDDTATLENGEFEVRTFLHLCLLMGLKGYNKPDQHPVQMSFLPQSEGTMEDVFSCFIVRNDFNS
ncbi:MAG: hypothetical protein JRI46_00825 [Deltaproteobacteria bacterium]|nr:hypothetical protein [Deltaproteobacteria bacterium]